MGRPRHQPDAQADKNECDSVRKAENGLAEEERRQDHAEDGHHEVEGRDGADAVVLEQEAPERKSPRVSELLSRPIL
jgi:hypothetical protein